ncbi:NTP transferase domain-containing protein [Bradyrhizobium sp. ISRA442]|uniref:cytidylyltransferase domain-containing protein n=1 Tax=Bradyrhizobium sp. ISRA442 TaxID=2866197 RepID=UPI00311B3B9C
MGCPAVKLGVIIQARMGSTRLPGKVLRPIGGKPLLGHVLDRAQALRHPATVVVATTLEPRDDAIFEFCKRRGTELFRGSEANVLDRYYQCARLHGFDHVVRLTADNPFTDIAELDRLIDLHLSRQADFSHSFRVLPIGVGAEIFRFDALKETAERSTEPHHFEHVDEYMLEHPERFRTEQLDAAAGKEYPQARLTVDDETDYRRACYIVEHTDGEITTERAIALCLQFA